MRIGYTFYNGVFSRVHDVWYYDDYTQNSKASYLMWLIERGKLPDTYEGQLYHQPFSYLFTAGVCKILQLMTYDRNIYFIGSIGGKLGSCMASCMTLLFSLKLCKELKMKAENIILAMQAKRGMFKLLPMSRQNEIADKYIELLQIKTASRETLIGQLSGGNQQKVILARWLATDPEFLILDEPTRGIDVGTKTEIQKLVIELADQGKSLIFISSEIEEMLRTCSKLVVLRDGQEVGEITEELTQGHVMQSIAGGGRNE